MKTQENLNGAAREGTPLGGDFDSVNLLGLDDFGLADGMWSLYGAMIGAGVGTLTAIGVRSFKGEYGGYSELIGLGAGLAAGAALAVSQKTRHAGFVAMASAVVSNGLRAAEFYFKGLQVKSTATQRPYMPAPTADKGLYGPGYSVEALGLTQAVPVNGLGTSRQVALLGGPQVDMMAKNYGSSYLSR